MAAANILQSMLEGMETIEPACRDNARGSLRRQGRFLSRTPVGSTYRLDGKLWVIANDGLVYRCDDEEVALAFLKTVDHLSNKKEQVA